MSDSSLSQQNNESNQESTSDRRDVAVTQPLELIAEAQSLVSEFESTDSEAPSSFEPVRATPEPSREDYSIDEYMSSLLERYGGSSDGYASPSASEPAPGSGASTVDAGERDEPAETRQTWTPSRPPEGKEDLEALRVVANVTARGAVNSHLGRQLVNHTSLKLVLAAASTCASFICLMAARNVPMFGMVAVAAAIGGIFWTGQFLSLTSQLKGLGTLMAEAEMRESSDEAETREQETYGQPDAL